MRDREGGANECYWSRPHGSFSWTSYGPTNDGSHFEQQAIGHGYWQHLPFAGLFEVGMSLQGKVKIACDQCPKLSPSRAATRQYWSRGRKAMSGSKLVADHVDMRHGEEVEGRFVVSWTR